MIGNPNREKRERSCDFTGMTIKPLISQKKELTVDWISFLKKVFPLIVWKNCHKLTSLIFLCAIYLNSSYSQILSIPEPVSCRILFVLGDGDAYH